MSELPNQYERQKKSGPIFSISTDRDNDAAEVLQKLTDELKKAKAIHGKYTDITITTEYYEGDSDQLPHSQISLKGSRLETDEEWYARIYYLRAAMIRNLETAANTIKNKAATEQKIAAIDEALKQSSLVCVDCKKPEMGQISSLATNGKTIRLCHDCEIKREIEIEAKEVKKAK